METTVLEVTVDNRHAEEAKALRAKIDAQADQIKTFAPDTSSLHFRLENVDPEVMKHVHPDGADAFNFDLDTKRLNVSNHQWSPGGMLYWLTVYSAPAENDPAETFTVVVNGQPYQVKH